MCASSTCVWIDCFSRCSSVLTLAHSTVARRLWGRPPLAGRRSVVGTITTAGHLSFCGGLPAPDCCCGAGAVSSRSAVPTRVHYSSLVRTILPLLLPQLGHASCTLP